MQEHFAEEIEALYAEPHVDVQSAEIAASARAGARRRTSPSARERLEILTTSPGVRRVHELAAADVDPDVAEAAEEDEVARRELVVRRPAFRMLYCDAAWCGSETPTCAKT